MPGSMPATSQLDWLISMTAMIVLFWSRATRDLLKSFGWGIWHSIGYMQRRSCHPRRPPHSVSRSHSYESSAGVLPKGFVLGLTPCHNHPLINSEVSPDVKKTTRYDR